MSVEGNKMTKISHGGIEEISPQEFFFKICLGFLTELPSGHCRLKVLRKIGIVDDAICRFCRAKNKILQHIKGCTLFT